MKLRAFIRGIKKVHKEATAETPARDILEFKVESLQHELYDKLAAVSPVAVLIDIEPEQRSLISDKAGR